jgi:transcriptional regulator with XRE-family HTH domain
MGAIEKRKHVMQPWTLSDAPRADLVEAGMEFLGELIYHARCYLGYSQQHVADAARLSQSTVSRLERGQLQGIRLHRLVPLLVLLADGLDVAVTIWKRRRGDAIRAQFR